MSLPKELTDYIIDEVVNDQHSIATCAFVCKNWADRTRRRLFAEVGLNQSNLQDFVEILTHPLTSINPIHIRQLSLSFMHLEL